MNDDIDKFDSIDVDLQIRIMNLVMGEVSDFERDQLRLLVEQRNDVAGYMRYLEQLHGMLCEAGTGELDFESDSSKVDRKWKLPSDRREKVLAVLNGSDQHSSTSLPLSQSNPETTPVVTSRWLTAATMMVCVCIFVFVLTLPSIQARRRSAKGYLSYGPDIQGGMDVPATVPLQDAPLSAYFLDDNVPDFAPESASSTTTEKQKSEYERFSRDFDVTEERVGKLSVLPESKDQVANGRFMRQDDLDQLFSLGKEPKLYGVGQPENVRGFRPSGDGASIDDALPQPVQRYGDSNTLMLSTSPKIIVPDWEEESIPQSIAATEELMERSSAEEKDSHIHFPSMDDWSRISRIREMTVNATPSGLQALQVEESLSLDNSYIESPTTLLEDKELADNGVSREKVRELAWAIDRAVDLKGETKLGYREFGLYSFDRSVVPKDSDEKENGGTVLWREQKQPIKKGLEVDNVTQSLEQSASVEAFSTFSLHVGDVSFQLANSSLGQGQMPDASKIRIEEFVNALDYYDPLPTGAQKVACCMEQAIHPYLMQRNLLRVSMRTSIAGRSQSVPLRLTLLLDNSGSMERPDRRQAVMQAFQSLTAQLKPTDQITLIGFASTPRLLADKVAGDQGDSLRKIVENLPSEGGTNIEAALLLAQEKATEQHLEGAQNRIVVLTDGAVNLGDANPESLAKLITQLRDRGIAFDAAGIGIQDLNDDVLERLTRQGDGRYYVVNSPEQASESFSAQIAGALRPSARNVKVQVEFNPKRIGRYQLFGFENHRLNKEDFRNDQVDAAELAAAEAGVAVYQIEPLPNGSGDIGTVSVRFQDISTGQMVERRWPIPYEPNAPRLDQAASSLQLAATCALFAAKLKGGPVGDRVDLAYLRNLISNLSDSCSQQPRVQQLRTMIDQTIAILGTKP